MHRAPLRACFLLFSLCLACVAIAPAQTIPLASVKKLYVLPFGPEKQDAVMRQSLVEHLKKSGYQVVDSANSADAVLKGDGQVWIKGHFTINSRAAAANREPVYAGFLSVELNDKDGEPLWSCLVTPSRFRWSNIIDDLADTLTDTLVQARKDTTAAATAPGSSQPLAATTLTGSGATFPIPLYRLWFQSFERLHPSVRLEYSESGSETGVQALVDRKADFAASDVSPREMSTAALHTAHFRQFATVLGGVVPVYHLDGLTTDLNFTPQLLADIYLGKVTRWNDPELRNANRDANLPDAPIVVVHRSDGSGTTHAWSAFLSKTVPEWQSRVGVGTQLSWPVGQGAQGSEGVASAVQATPNSIGYVEFVFAIQHQLSFGSVRNSAGQFVRANLDSLAAAARTLGSSGLTGPSPSIIDAPGKTAYPIASFTWLLIPETIGDAARKQALLELIRWELTYGQKESSALGYAPLPPEVASQQLDTLNDTLNTVP